MISSEKFAVPLYTLLCIPEVTVITCGESNFCRCSTKSDVNKNAPNVFVANVVSNPSSVSSRLLSKHPALFTKTFKGTLPVIRLWANSRTSFGRLTSTTCRKTSVFSDQRKKNKFISPTCFKRDKNIVRLFNTTGLE